jgi:hypothetical protein
MAPGLPIRCSAAKASAHAWGWSRWDKPTTGQVTIAYHAAARSTKRPSVGSSAARRPGNAWLTVRAGWSLASRH